MFKKIFCFLIIGVIAFADVLNVKNFQADVYSKMSKDATKKVSISLDFIGDELNDNSSYILDTLNVVIGSFYIEDLLTSLGKEKLKETLKKYAAKKHSINVDDVLILNLKIVEKLQINEIINAIKSRNLCSSTTMDSDQNSIIVSPNLKNVDQAPIDLNTIKEFK